MLYLLHFYVPLEHAQHYLGCTDNLVQRLKAHARGKGANLTRVLFECGLEWTVAALWTIPPDMTIRQAEKWAKRTRNGKRFCPLCTETNKQYPKYGRRYAIPPDMDIDSIEIRKRLKCTNTTTRECGNPKDETPTKSPILPLK